MLASLTRILERALVLGTTLGLYGCSRLLRISPLRAPGEPVLDFLAQRPRRRRPESLVLHLLRCVGAPAPSPLRAFQSSCGSSSGRASSRPTPRMSARSCTARRRGSCICGCAAFGYPLCSPWRERSSSTVSRVQFATESARLTRRLARTPTRRVDLSTQKGPVSRPFPSGACRDRTGDLQLAKLALSQLS